MHTRASRAGFLSPCLLMALAAAPATASHSTFIGAVDAIDFTFGLG